MKKNILAILFILLILPVVKLMGQIDTCVAHLKDAGVAFDQGNYDDAIGMLRNSIQNCPLDKTDKINAYSILILSYLSVDNLEAADKAAKQVMNIKPNYAPDKFKDDPRIIRLFQKYKPQPVFSFGISAGINFPVIHVSNAYSVKFPEGATSYKSKTGFQLGLKAEKLVYRSLWAELGFRYRLTVYQHDISDVQNSSVHYSERLFYTDFPISAKYYVGKKNIQPYIQGGLYCSILTNALSTTSRDNFKDIVNRYYLRNGFSLGYFGCAGGSYAIKSFRLFADVRYIYAPQNVNKSGTRYNDAVNLYKYYYIDDDFQMDNIQLNFGASYVLKYRISKQ